MTGRRPGQPLTAPVTGQNLCGSTTGSWRRPSLGWAVEALHLNLEGNEAFHAKQEGGGKETLFHPRN
jgi:hypothetical protein